LSEIQYDQNGANPVTSTSTYTYDSYRNRKSEVSNTSTAVQLTSSYNYAADAITGLSATATTGKTAMVNASMFGIPLEKTVMKGSIQQSHTRLDYQSYTSGITFPAPLNSYSAVSGNSLESETQYISYDNTGNNNEYITRSGIPTSILWDYNQAYPTVKIENANTKLSVQQLGTGTFGGNFTTSASYPITLSAIGTIGISVYGANANLSISYFISGPTNKSGSLCNACGSSVNMNFTNMAAGSYTVLLTVSSNNGTHPSLLCSGTFPQTQTVTITEYYYEGFEQGQWGTNVTNGGAHTGNLYYTTNFNVNFTLPNSRTYLIQWWNLAGGVWKFNQQTYTGPTTLTGPVDDVRIFPSDALMTTYSYAPLIGMTGKIDPQGHTTYFNYDVFQRLIDVQDENHNILKVYNYKYQQPK